MKFKGDEKAGKSILHGPEEQLKKWLLPLVPIGVETYHLTLTTILWSLLVILFGFLAGYDRKWLWGSSIVIVLQYITDLLDGAIGRQRNTGLIKWGYYMDHFLDYIFLCSILIGYSLMLPDNYKYILFFIVALFGAFMVNSYLSFAATNSFSITYLGIGPTEIRILFVIINTLLIVFGKTYLARGLPWVLVLSAFGLFIAVYKTHRQIWAVDMAAKHGTPIETSADRRALAKETLKNLGVGILRGRIIACVTVSFLLAFAGLTVRMLRLGYPYHGPAAIIIYVLSGLPFLFSIRLQRAVLRQQKEPLKRIVRPYMPHVVVALILIVCAYVAWVLVPVEDTVVIRMDERTLQQSLVEDSHSIRMLGGRMDSLLDWAEETSLLSKDVGGLTLEEKAEIREFWGDFTLTFLELGLLKTRYRGYYQIDRNTRASSHADAFMTFYAALVIQTRCALRLQEMVGDNEFMKTMLNEADPDRGVPALSFVSMEENVSSADSVVRLNHGVGYTEAVANDLFRAAHLEQVVADGNDDIRAILVKRPGSFIEGQMDAFDEKAFTVWFPFQKEVAIQMSHIRAVERENFITPELIAEHRDKLEPGDLLLQRRNWEMTNVGIPGFWPHVAIFIGTPAELNEYFEGVPELKGQPAFECIRAKYPGVARAWESRDENGYVHSVIEALRDGIVLTSLEESGSADYLAALRPNVSKRDKFKAVLTALSHYGKPYDYNFDFATDNELVCTELVYKSYEKVRGLKFEPRVVNGRWVLPPNDLAEKFAAEYGRDVQQLELALFLDGNEERQTVSVSDADEFAKTAARPKWDVLLE